jgi:hypothetical protein
MEEFRAAPVPALAGPAAHPITHLAAAAGREDTLTADLVSWRMESRLLLMQAEKAVDATVALGALAALAVTPLEAAVVVLAVVVLAVVDSHPTPGVVAAPTEVEAEGLQLDTAQLHPVVHHRYTALP